MCGHYFFSIYVAFRGLEILAFELSILGLNPDPAINGHPGVLGAGQFINVCSIHLKDEPEDSSIAALEVVDIKDPILFFVKSS